MTKKINYLKKKSIRIEDENFEEEFEKWLNTKTEDELIESMKKYMSRE